MARASAFELIEPTGSGVTTSKILLGPEIARGGAGVVYRMPGDLSSVIKIYHDKTTAADLDDYRRRIEAMVDLQPDLKPISEDGRRYVQIAWPTAVVNRPRQFAGFRMPAVDIDKTELLERVLVDRHAVQYGLRTDLGAKVTLARQLAGVVAALHKIKHYVVDLKPQNVQFYKDTLYMAVLDCDGFSINDARNGRRYPAPMFTGEYLAPEFLGGKRNPNVDPEAQDRFALAVVIFQLVNHGLHPYNGVQLNPALPADTPSCIPRHDYAYGRQKNPSVAPRPFSTHHCVPDDLRDYFDRAFGRTPANRPSAFEWQTLLERYATRSQGYIVQCTQDRAHYHFKGMPCSSCLLDGFRRRATSLPKPAAPSSSLRHAPSQPSMRVANARVSQRAPATPSPFGSSAPAQTGASARPMPKAPVPIRSSVSAPPQPASKKARLIGLLVMAVAVAAFISTRHSDQPAPQVIAPIPAVPEHYSPSFDCTKTTNATDLAICGNKTLSALDVQMARAYRVRVAQLSGEREAQRRWVRERQARCGTDAACLAAMYSERLVQLREAVPALAKAKAAPQGIPKQADASGIAQVSPQPAEATPTPVKATNATPDLATQAPTEQQPVATAPQTVITHDGNSVATASADNSQAANQPPFRVRRFNTAGDNPSDGQAAATSGDHARLQSAYYQLIGEGERAFSSQNYSAAIANAQAALALAPQDARATLLLQRSKDAQQKAMSNISIQ